MKEEWFTQKYGITWRGRFTFLSYCISMVFPSNYIKSRHCSRPLIRRFQASPCPAMFFPVITGYPPTLLCLENPQWVLSWRKGMLRWLNHLTWHLLMSRTSRSISRFNLSPYPYIFSSLRVSPVTLRKKENIFCYLCELSISWDGFDYSLRIWEEITSV